MADLSVRINEFSTYICFVVCTVFVAILLFIMFFKLDEFFFLLRITLYLGWLIWGPIIIVALFPGYHVFKSVSGRCMSHGLNRRITVVLSSIAVALVATLGMNVITSLYSNDSLMATIKVNLMIFPFGLVSALVMGQLFYVR